MSIRDADIIKADIDYNVRLATLHARFYRRLRAGLSFISLVGGSAAFAGILSQDGAMTAIAGALIALTPILDNVINPGDKAAAHDNMRSRYYELRQQLMRSDVTAAEADVMLHGIYADPLDEIEGLRKTAQNEADGQRGLEPIHTLTRWERFCRFIA